MKIYGAPDGVKTERGLLVPIEIKSHRDVRLTDRLELAFYWLLLAPYRTRRAKQPQGMLILRSPDGGVDHVSVDLKDTDFVRLRGLLRDVRRARRDGVKPSICDCEVCATRPEIVECVRREKGVTLVWGIAARRAQLLSQIGIRSLDDILACDPQLVITHLRKHRHVVSEPMVRRWKHHARSHLNGAPVVFGAERLDHHSFIAVDLEYVSADPGTIYLIGAVVVDDGDERPYQWWGDEPLEIAANLRRFRRLLKEHPGVPVLTWAGEDAEIPEFSKAAAMHGIPGLTRELRARHFDMFTYTERNVRLPIPYLDLKSVGRYFGVRRGVEVSGGMMADYLYRKYTMSADQSEKKRLQSVLLEYNRDDLGALIPCVSI